MVTATRQPYIFMYKGCLFLDAGSWNCMNLDNNWREFVLYWLCFGATVYLIFNIWDIQYLGA